MQQQNIQNCLDLTITGSVIGQSTSSYMASRRVVHIMVRSSLLNILYRRLKLDGRYFVTKYLDNVPYIKFKKTPKNIKDIKDPYIADYFHWLLAIKHAIDRSYLKEVFLYLKSPSGDILEAFKFRLKYNPQGDKAYISMPQPPEVKLNAMSLMSVIQSLGEIEKLEDDTITDLHITYNEDTPKEYEPPGFKADTDTLPSFIINGHTPISIGSMNTGFHKITCYGIGALLSELEDIKPSQVDNTEKNIERTNSIKLNDENEENNKDDSFVIFDNDGPLDTVTREIKKTLDLSGITVEESENDEIITLISSDRDASEAGITDGNGDCVLCEMRFDGIELLTCNNCAKIHHSVCHGYLEVDETTRKEFMCNNCGETDESLNNFPDQMKNVLAKIRLLMYYAKKEGKLLERILETFCPEVRENILTQINKNNILQPDQSINQETLPTLLNVLFNDSKCSQFFE